MDFTFTFIKIFALTLYFLGPLLLFFLFLIALLGYFIGRAEKWSVIDSFYFAFITATTVGYGDFHPSHSRSKIFAVLIAFIGVLCTGIIVSAGFKAVEIAFASHYEIEEIINHIKMQLS